MTVVPHRSPATVTEQEADDPLSALAGLGRALATARQGAASSPVWLADVARVIDATAVAIFTCGAPGAAPACLASLGPFEALGLGAEPGSGALDRCLASRAIVCVDRQAGRPDDGRPRSLACAPLVMGDGSLGVLAVARDRPGALGRDEIHFLEAVATLIALHLANLNLAQDLARQEGVTRELDLAAEIQRNLLPNCDPARSPVHGLNRPIRRVSGDFFDFFWLDRNRIAFALGDVSGKGINAALLMAKTAGLFRCLAKSHDDPATLLEAINRELWETASRGMFVTLVAGIYHSTTGQIAFANAGHEPPLLRAPDRSYRAFPADQPPLGILPSLSFETEQVDLAGGEFYIFSDGLTEYRYGDREALGVKGLIQLLESMAGLPLRERLSTLLADLDQEGWEVRDDLTVLAIDDTWIRRHD